MRRKGDLLRKADRQSTEVLSVPQATEVTEKYVSRCSLCPLWLLVPAKLQGPGYRKGCDRRTRKVKIIRPGSAR
jgi:hypothetical protein